VPFQTGCASELLAFDPGKKATEESTQHPWKSIWVFDSCSIDAMGSEKPLNADSVLCWLQETAGARNCGWRRTEKRKGEKK
jgi:hypothetical protein